MKNKKGQILLITVMLLATVMTIVLSISFKSVTETQVTKLEEESQKALSAAESAIDVALKENQNVTIGAGSLSSITGFSGNATINSTASKTFTTPSIPKNGSYTSAPSLILSLGSLWAGINTRQTSSAWVIWPKLNVCLFFVSQYPAAICSTPRPICIASFVY